MSNNNLNIETAVTEKKVSINDFIKKYNSASSEQIKQKMMQEVIYSNDYYVPYAVKVVTANQIIETSSFKADGEVYFNGPKQYQIYIAALLSLYTKFDVSNHFETSFDLLCREHLLEGIIKNMPEDREEFEIVFQLAQTDFERNYVEKRLDEKRITEAVFRGFIKGLNDILDNIGIGTTNFNDMQTIITEILKSQSNIILSQNITNDIKGQKNER